MNGPNWRHGGGFRRLPKAGSLSFSLLLFLAALPALAQSSLGTIRGVAKDEGGNSLPGVTIEATNDASGVTRTAVTGLVRPNNP